MQIFREKNAKKVFGHIGPNGPLWIIFGQKGAIFEFSVKERKRHFFTHFFSFFNTENSNVRVFGKMGTYVRTTKKGTLLPLHPF